MVGEPGSPGAPIQEDGFGSRDLTRVGDSVRCGESGGGRDSGR